MQLCIHAPSYRRAFTRLAAIAFALLWTALQTASAQVNSYTFRSGTGGEFSTFAFAPLTDGRVIASGDTLDDQVFTNIPLGFTVRFNGREL